MNKQTPLGDPSSIAQITIDWPASIAALTQHQPFAAKPVGAKAGEMLNAKAAPMAVKPQANLSGETAVATLPLRRIAEVLTGGSVLADGPAFLASKEAY